MKIAIVGSIPARAELKLSLPCAKGGAEERGGGIVKHINLIKNNPSVSFARFACKSSPIYTREPFHFCAN